MTGPSGLLCGTRAIKNAKYLQKMVPELMPQAEPEDGFGSIIPINILAGIHDRQQYANLGVDQRLADQLANIKFPEMGAQAASSLFSGTVFFVRIEFTVRNQNNAVFAVSAADAATAVDYAQRAIAPISLYAAKFGPNKVTVTSDILSFKVTLNSSTFNDSDLQRFVNQIASQNRLPSATCVVVLNPLGIENTSGPRPHVGGYHSKANIPYIIVNVSGQNFAISDPGFLYAGAVSHELAEMVVDPEANGSNPEVCDPCGPNCASTWLDYFDDSGTYIKTSQQPVPPNFPYAFYINGIMKPGTKPCPMPAPDSACNYAPITVGQAVLASHSGLVAVAEFFSSDDNFRHALVGTSDGKLTEVFFNPKVGIRQDELGTFPGIVSVAGFFSSDDNFRHALVGTSDGKLTEVFFNPKVGIRQDELGTFPGIVSVAGFFSSDDNFRHALVGTSDGKLTEVFFNPKVGIRQDELGTFPGIVSVAGFFSSDDNFRHALVGTSDGKLTEVFFNPKVGIRQDELGTFPGIVSVAGFFSPDDNSRHATVVTRDGKLTDVYFNPDVGIRQTALKTLPGPIGVAGFFSDDDNYRHAIVATNDGNVTEVYFDLG